MSNDNRLTLERNLADLLECAKRAEEKFSWVADRGGKITYIEEDLRELRKAIRAIEPGFVGPHETCRGKGGSFEPGDDHYQQC